MTTISISPTPKHEISPYLYMQFMEPLGACDSSVDAAWNFEEGDWHECVLDTVRDLAPTMVRFGGCFASYYKWKEGVGPFRNRPLMFNQLWGGVYANQVGTHEIVDFCRRVNAEPLLVVNMESDGRMHWAYPKSGGDRFGTAEEAAEWVSYCNSSDHSPRAANGSAEPFHVKYWQIGNETSYDLRGYPLDKAYDVTRRFAEKMRRADPGIRLIVWGDDGKYDECWAEKMGRIDEAELLAFHHHFGSGLPDSPLTGTEYRRDYSRTWEHLMHAYKSMEAVMEKMRACRGSKRLAMTEGHFALPGRNRNEVLSSWGAGVAYARCHNVIMRNSDVLDIATMADFFGNVWQVNAVMIPTPVDGSRKPYLQPVGAVMRLFGRHQGKYAVELSCDGAVDATASRTENTLYLHLANTDMSAAKTIRLSVGEERIAAVRMYVIDADPRTEITPVNPDCFAVREAAVQGDTITLPAAAVAAVEIDLA